MCGHAQRGCKRERAREKGRGREKGGDAPRDPHSERENREELLVGSNTGFNKEGCERGGVGERGWGGGAGMHARGPRKG